MNEITCYFTVSFTQGELIKHPAGDIWGKDTMRGRYYGCTEGDYHMARFLWDELMWIRDRGRPGVSAHEFLWTIVVDKEIF